MQVYVGMALAYFILPRGIENKEKVFIFGPAQFIFRSLQALSLKFENGPFGCVLM